MKKIDAQQMCDELNKLVDGDSVMIKALMTRFEVDYAEEPTSLNYSIDGDGVKRTSALGVINGLVSEAICVMVDEEDRGVYSDFKLLSQVNKKQ